ncbi:MAG: acyl carrier protein [Sphingobium sp.]
MRAEPLKDDALPSSLDETLRATLRDVLGLSAESVAAFGPETELFGALPELDSMAVATLLTEIEDRFSILIDDDDIDGETFETFGTLTSFIRGKLPGQA